MIDWLCVFAFVCMTVMGAFGSFGLKKGLSSANGFAALIVSPWFLSGAALYFLSALLNIWLLKTIPYVVVLPLTSLTYCWSVALAHFFLQEKVSRCQVFGLACIVLGAVLMVV